MAVLELDGIDDSLRFTGSFGAPNNGTNGFSTLLVLRPLTNSLGAECYSSIASAASGLVTLGALYHNTTTAWAWGSDNPSVDSSATPSPSTANWAVGALTKATGSVAPVIHYCPLGGTPQHLTGSAPVANSSGTAATNWFFGVFPDGTGFRDYRLAVAAYFLRSLSSAEVESVQTARTTTSIYALNPVSLIDFNQASTATSPPDLMGIATLAARTGTTVITTDDPPSWVFGLGVSGSSTANQPGVAGQFSPHINYRMWL